MYQTIDITGWNYVDIAVSGSKEKRWYRMPHNNNLVLFKLPVSLTAATWTSIDESTGEMWSEKIASELGSIIGVTTHQVDIGLLKVDDKMINHYRLDPRKVRNGVIYGALCHSFLIEGEESLVEGADMIMEYDHTYDRRTLQGEREVYSYQLLVRLFDKYGWLDDLYKMLVFDTLIGNTDRHQDNFGAIRSEIAASLRFAPLYDNSSSLGRELFETKMKSMLTDLQRYDAYIFNRKSSSLIKWRKNGGYLKMGAFELLRNATVYTPGIKESIAELALLTDESIANIVQNIPSEVMSEIKKQFVQKVVMTRRDYILREFKS